MALAGRSVPWCADQRMVLRSLQSSCGCSLRSANFTKAAVVRPNPQLRASLFGRSSKAPVDTNSTTINADTTPKKLPPDVMRMFQEAQKNILDLNNSRLNALEELKAARTQIAELEMKLEEAERAATTVPEESAPTAAPPAAVSPTAPTITVVYATGWAKVFLHHKADDKGWTNVPGTAFEEGTGEFAGSKVATVEASSMDFVLTNGEGSWDTPDPATGGNYRISGPGVYLLKDGKISKK